MCPLSRHVAEVIYFKRSRISGGVIRLITHHSSLITKTHRPQADGFTLLEILVAVFILGVVVTTVLSSFNMVFSNADALESSASTFEMGRSCMARITRDLENAFILMPPLYKPPALDTPPDPYRFQGTVENRGGTALAALRFTSQAHVPLEGSQAGGIAEIVYYMQAAPEGGLRLKRADNLYPYPRFEERSEDPVLCENVKSLAFEYLDTEGTASDAWDSESPRTGTATPVMVAVRLEIGDRDDSFGFQTTVALPLVRPKSR